MSSLSIAFITLACSTMGLLLGMLLAKALPQHHLDHDSKEILKVAAGLIATLAALVLGLLVSSSKSSFDAASSGLTQVGAKVITLDRTLARYGPEAKAARDRLRSNLEIGISRLWPKEHPSQASIGEVELATETEELHEAIEKLSPQTDEQKNIQAQALQICDDLMQSRWLLIEQARTPLPTAFIVTLIFWLVVLNLCFGLLAPRNATCFIALFVGAVSVSGAMFLILEMTHPFEGSIKVPSAPLQKAIDLLQN